ncbi:hypothetical protein AKJ38_01255 [candidate division MSBL1 archaeon SCGC-AAA259I14]|uniref:Uncharacterized protein n=1 Tax=candidate division MSBL1 archaeon SCGC-AAA259I14 TaxID=1698268 RepID=A0A133UT65_9EURY|nr:hypothetical protein AKJ38_01255 [candidate division MSBL1 archaeon SCGC-AAA259I14]
MVRVSLNDLSAEHTGKLIETEAIVAGESGKKTLPKKFIFRCSRCGDEFPASIKRDGKLRPRVIRAFLSNSLKEFAKQEVGYRCRAVQSGRHDFGIEESPEKLRYRVLHLREPPRKRKRPENESKSKVLETTITHLIGPRLPATRNVKIQAIPTTNPESRDLILLTDEIEEIRRGWRKFQITEEDKKNFDEYFDDVDPSTLHAQIAQN